MPRLPRSATAARSAELGTVLPAVTCSAQSTFLTGTLPAEHGIVGNGWYFRDLGEVLLWRQHNALVGGEKLWDAARRAAPRLHGGQRLLVVRDGRGRRLDGHPAARSTTPTAARSPDCYTRPARPARRADQPNWARSRCSTTGGRAPAWHRQRWIIGAARAHHGRATHPDLTLVYVPHLDYDLQRYGPPGPAAAAAAAELDAVLGPAARRRPRAAGRTVVALSEYGITPVARPVDINRALRRAGLLEVHTQDGMEYLDPWTSRAFAVADHQVAHVYVADPADLAGGARRCCAGAARASPRCSTTRASGARPGPPALRGAGRGRRAGRLVHLLLLAGRRPRARLRPAGRDPPQARLRPGRAVLRPGRDPVRPRRRGRSRAGPQEARHALPDEPWSAWTPVPPRCAASTAGCRDRPGDGPVLLCSEPAGAPAPSARRPRSKASCCS